MMNLTELIAHPERMDRETLYDLRSLIALHPYYQPARLLMLQNLYLRHDPTFDEELRRAAIYISDRRILFQLIELMGEHLLYFCCRFTQIHAVDKLHPSASELTFAPVGIHAGRSEQP